MTKLPEHDWKQDSKSFDAVASLYDAYRPTYPPELVERIVALADLQAGSKILEIGCGTGKATVLFARRGYSMLCLEPGRNLAAVAAHNLKDYPNVKFEQARFEEWMVRPNSFDLVISAQAFHWVPKEVGYARAAESLQPQGHLALFWNMYPGLDEPLSSAISQVYQERAPELAARGETYEETARRRQAEIIESGCFEQVVQERFPWMASYTTREYLGLLNTYSDHLRLAEATRQQLFTALAGVIDSQGGVIQKSYVAVLYVGRRK